MDQLFANFNKEGKIKTFLDPKLLQDGKACLIGAIDQGTSSTRFLIFSKDGRVVASAQMEHTQIFPDGEDKVGWHEHDPIEIWDNVVACVDAVSGLLKKRGVDLDRFPLQAVGLTNQRETTIAWNSLTGVPYYNAIVWDDVRTGHIADHIADGNVHRLRDKTGLPLASYFAGTKVKWLLDKVAQLQADIADPEMSPHVRFGTIDTW
ncbi:FGGY kinase [Fragilaria crotonensis]|nr:FGGY kinase [Fragilaria crotonensis]